MNTTQIKMHWSRLPAGGGEIAKAGKILLHVAGARGNWAFMVTDCSGLNFVKLAEGDGIRTKNEAMLAAEEALAA